MYKAPGKGLGTELVPIDDRQIDGLIDDRHPTAFSLTSLKKRSRHALAEHLSQTELLSLAFKTVCSLALPLISRCSFARVIQCDRSTCLFLPGQRFPGKLATCHLSPSRHDQIPSLLKGIAQMLPPTGIFPDSFLPKLLTSSK